MDWLLTAAVLIHLAINIVHGQAHIGAAIPLPLASTLFVYVVILAGPLAGLALTWWRPAAGAWLVAASLAGALVFGLVNHFIIAGPDRVDHVAAEWRTQFRVSALLLLVSEAAGVAIGVRSALRRTLRSAS
jgi:F0F1-type ATP synthase membrane subunit a